MSSELGCEHEEIEGICKQSGDTPRMTNETSLCGDPGPLEGVACEERPGHGGFHNGFLFSWTRLEDGNMGYSSPRRPPVPVPVSGDTEHARCQTCGGVYGEHLPWSEWLKAEEREDESDWHVFVPAPEPEETPILSSDSVAVQGDYATSTEELSGDLSREGAPVLSEARVEPLEGDESYHWFNVTLPTGGTWSENVSPEVQAFLRAPIEAELQRVRETAFALTDELASARSEAQAQYDTYEEALRERDADVIRRLVCLTCSRVDGTHTDGCATVQMRARYSYIAERALATPEEDTKQ